MTGDSTFVTHADVYDGRPSTSVDNVMMSADSSPTLQASGSSNHYPELPDEPRPGKIRPSTPLVAGSLAASGGGASSSSPSHPSNNSTASLGAGNRSAGPSGAESPEVEAIEEAVPIVRATLPSPEPRPTVERNGYKAAHATRDELDDKIDGSIRFTPAARREVDDDSCLIKCVYFTQQCCECTII